VTNKTTTRPGSAPSEASAAQESATLVAAAVGRGAKRRGGRRRIAIALAAEVTGTGLMFGALVAVAANAGHLWATVEAGVVTQVVGQVSAAAVAVGVALWLRTRTMARRIRAYISPRPVRGEIGRLLGEEDDDEEYLAAVNGARVQEGSSCAADTPSPDSAMSHVAASSPPPAPLDSFDEYPGFPFVTFANLVRCSTDIKILGTYLYQLINPEDCRRFLAALTDAVERGAGVKIMLLCPESKAAAQRARELKVPPAHMKQEMERNLAVLFRWRMSLPEELQEHVDIRLYPHKPPAQGPLYVCDEVALVSSLPLGLPSQDSPHLRYPTMHPHMGPLLDFFTQVWGGGVQLEQHMIPTLRTNGADGHTLHGARTVEDKGIPHVAVRSRTDRHAVERNAVVQMQHGTQAATHYRLVQVHDPAQLDTLDGELNERYGEPRGEYDFYRMVKAKP
jgi:hypothetical protein